MINTKAINLDSANMIGWDSDIDLSHDEYLGVSLQQKLQKYF